MIDPNAPARTQQFRDIQVLWRTGIWPNGEVPEWAATLVRERYFGSCSPASSHIIIEGLLAEIAALNAGSGS